MIPTNSPLLAAVAPYAQSDVLTSTDLTFGFSNAGVVLENADPEGALTTLSWTETQKQYVRDLYAYVSTVVNLNFTEAEAGPTVNFVFHQVPEFSDDTAGYQEPTGPQTSILVMPTEFIGYDDVTLIHEMGHGLALSHPFDGPASLPGVSDSGDLGDFSLNTELATRMAYTPGASALYPGVDIIGESYTYGALDIAALQLLYGANTSTGLGDTVYGSTPQVITIWDNGGHDMIDYSSATDDAVIDLRPATLEADAGGGGYLSFIKEAGGDLVGGMVANGGYTIAFGVDVEDARGGSGNDLITGNALDNLLSGNGGNDMIIGGDGVDSALYSGMQDNYTLTLSAQGMTLTDRRADGDGTDTLVDIEALAFGDNTGGPFDLSKFGGAQTLGATDMQSFVELYIAYFNRAPDAVGLNFWGTAFANGTTLEEMATLFIDQDETRETYDASLSNADFVTAVYANVLGREGDQAGMDFWLSTLDDGTQGRDQFILGVLGGAKVAIENGTTEQLAQQQTDQQYLSTKTDIGAYYAVTKGMSDVTNAKTAMTLFDGSAEGTTAAQNAIDGFYASALDAENGAYLMPLVGVLDDPFGGAVA